MWRRVKPRYTRPGTMDVRTTGMLLLGPAAALLLPNLVLSHTDALWRHLLRFRQGTVYHADAVIRLADAGAVDVVVMGSSVAHTDIRQELLDAQLADLDVHTVNVGLNGAPVSVNAMQLPAVLALEPRVVILVNAAPSLFRHPRYQPPEVYDAGVTWALDGPGAFLTDRERHLSGLLGQVSLLYRYRDVVREMDSDAFDGRDLRDSTRLPPGTVRGSVERQQRLYRAVHLDNQSERESDALCLMQAYVTAAGAELVVVPAPVHPRVRRSGYDRRHLAVLDALQARCGFHLVDADGLPPLGALAYRDGIHLLPTAQEAFTTAVAEQVRPLLEER